MRNDNDDDLSPIEALEKAERVASTHSNTTTCSSLNISYGELRPILAAARMALSTNPSGVTEIMAASHYDQRMGRIGAFYDAPHGTQQREINYMLAAIATAEGK